MYDDPFSPFPQGHPVREFQNEERDRQRRLDQEISDFKRRMRDAEEAQKKDEVWPVASETSKEPSVIWTIIVWALAIMGLFLIF